VVTSIGVSPTTIPNDGTGTVTVDFTATDDLSGMDVVDVTWISPSGNTAFIVEAWEPDDRVAGSPTNGVWRSIDPLPPLTETGIWEPEDIYVRDQTGNGNSIPSSEFADYGITVPNLTVVESGVRPPSTPNGVQASSSDSSSIDVSWNAASGATSYEVQYRISSVSRSDLSPMQPALRIIGGRAVPISQFPWQVALLRSGISDSYQAQFCGGSLIAPNWVVTAAHCVIGSAIDVGFGKTYLSRMGSSSRIPVVNTYVHPSWDSSTQDGADIALLELASNVPDGQPIAPFSDAALPPYGEDVWTSGWGNTNPWAPPSGFPDALHGVDLEVQAGPTDTTCGSWSSSVYNPDWHLCAGAAWEWKGSCVGDSGGPLVLIDDAEDRWELAGLTSFGSSPDANGCSNPALPTVYTRVSTYESWVASRVPVTRWSTAATASSTSTRINGLVAGYRYDVRVRAVGAGGVSAWSDPVTQRVAGHVQPPTSDVDIVILGGTAAVSNSVASQLQSCTSGSIYRIAGSNRYDTSAGISASFLSSPINIAYVATGENFPDALAGSAAAGVGLGGPILLVRHNSIPAETARELNRLRPSTIVILGGTAAVSSSVESALWRYGSVVRASGRDRYETATNASALVFDSADTVYMAVGTNFPDALAGAPAAIQEESPVLLTRQSSLPPSVGPELTRLHPSRIVVLGGTAAISSSVFQQLRSYAPEVVRVAGSNRFDTAARVSSAAFRTADVIFVSTGRNFPDALAGGPIAGIIGSPVLLVESSRVPVETKREIERLTGRSCG